MSFPGRDLRVGQINNRLSPDPLNARVVFTTHLGRPTVDPDVGRCEASTGPGVTVPDGARL